MLNANKQKTRKKTLNKVAFVEMMKFPNELLTRNSFGSGSTWTKFGLCLVSRFGSIDLLNVGKRQTDYTKYVREGVT
jgi:hypothetical protein